MSLELKHLRISLAERLLVDLTLEVPAGEVLSIMGPSGCGKSTALAAIIGALPDTFRQTGSIWLDGRDISALPPHRREIGILFQDDILFPHLSVAGNLGFGLPARSPDRSARIEAALTEAGLAGFGQRDPATLSGGQRARVALMRALLSGPKALLLDEPFSRLDMGLRAQIRAFVFARARAQGIPVLMVTHDPEDARAAEGRVITVHGAPIDLSAN